MNTRDILNEGMLTVDRLQALTDVIYRTVLEADGSCNAVEAARKKVQEAISLIEYAVMDLRSLDGLLSNAMDRIYKLNLDPLEAESEQREVSK